MINITKLNKILGTSVTLNSQPIEFTSISTDTRTLEPGALFVAIKGPTFDGHDFVEEAARKGALAAIVSRADNFSLPTFHVADTLDAFMKIAIHHRQLMSAKLVGVTGSCGKTTTRNMLASILSQAGETLSSAKSFNNHIGVPTTLLQLKPVHQYAVLEIGSNHFGEIEMLTNIVSPDVAVITNAASVHTEYFGDLEGVVCEKGDILNGLKAEGVAVINADDAFAQVWQEKAGDRRVILFGESDTAEVRATDVALNQKSQLGFTLVTPKGATSVALNVLGKHYVVNALAAAAAAYGLNIPLEKIKTGLEAAEPVDKRLCRYEGVSGAQLIDDSYNANLVSTKAALEVLAAQNGKRIFAFADMLELGDVAPAHHQEVGTIARELGINQLYAYGDLSRYTVEAFGDNAYHFKNKKDLITALKLVVGRETTVLAKGSKSMKMWEVIEALRGL